MDIFTPEQRSLIMARIRGKDTKPEVIVRKYLFALGLRYRKNSSSLPGKPDIVFPKYRTVVFVNGCFWHGHEGCKHFRLPSTRTDYWKAKIEANRKRDDLVASALEEKGWKVIVVWECEICEEKLLEVYEKITGARAWVNLRSV